jgi:hypothetical protein
VSGFDHPEFGRIEGFGSLEEFDLAVAAWNEALPADAPPTPADRIDELDPDLHPEFWKKCGGCPTLLPVDPLFDWKANAWHRVTEGGHELCSACTDEVMDAEQAASEFIEARNATEMATCDD